MTRWSREMVQSLLINLILFTFPFTLFLPSQSVLFFQFHSPPFHPQFSLTSPPPTSKCKWLKFASWSRCRKGRSGREGRWRGTGHGKGMDRCRWGGRCVGSGGKDVNSGDERMGGRRRSEGLEGREGRTKTVMVYHRWEVWLVDGVGGGQLADRTSMLKHVVQLRRHLLSRQSVFDSTGRICLLLNASPHDARVDTF